jgi:hypothetical protein
MAADPKLTPVTCGCVAGVVAPPATKTLDGDIITFEVSLLASVTITPSAGAGGVSESGNTTDSPGSVVTFVARLITDRMATRTAAEPLTYPDALAVIVAAPTESPVSVKAPLELPSSIMMLGGCKSTMPLGPDESVNVTPPDGAAAFRMILPVIVRESPTVSVPSARVIFGGTTLTVAVPEVKPAAEAVMEAVPVVFAAITVAFAPVAF